MQIIAMILSGLALLAASVSLILIIREKKRNEERNAAFERYKNTMLHYVDKKFEAVQAEMKKYMTEIKCQMEVVKEAAEKYTDKTAEKFLLDVSKRFTDEEISLWEQLNKEFESINKSLEALHKSSEEHDSMKKRVDEVMDMVEKIGDDLMNANTSFQDQLGKTLSNIMAFDPMEAQRKARLLAMGMGEDD